MACIWGMGQPLDGCEGRRGWRRTMQRRENMPAANHQNDVRSSRGNDGNGYGSRPRYPPAPGMRSNLKAMTISERK